MEGASNSRRAAADGTGVRRDAVMNVRLPIQTRELIDSAAALTGKTRTEFVLESARQRAADVLLDQQLLSLDAKAYATFLGVLDNPPPPSKELRALMATKAPWEA